MSGQQPLRSPFATLDVANTHRRIQSCFKQTPTLSRLLVDIFHEASPASAESAVLFLQRDVRTVKDAERIANITKSFAGAVPRQNIPALAQLSAFLAVSFDSPICTAPLECFSFTHSSAKRIAITAIHSRLRQEQQQQRAHALSSRKILEQIFPFFEHLVADPDSSIQRDAVHAITSLPSFISQAHVSMFLNRLPLRPSPFSSSFEPAVNGDRHTSNSSSETAFETFLVLTIARGSLPSNTSIADSSTAPPFCNVILRALLRAVDFNMPDTLYELNVAFGSQFTAAVFEISLDVFFFCILTLAASLACHGQLSHCVNTLKVAHTVVEDTRFYRSSLNPVTIAFVEISTTCITSLASVAACDEAVQLTSSLFQRISSKRRGMTSSSEKIISQVKGCIDMAIRSNCPGSLAVLLLLRGLLTKWDSSTASVKWVSEDVKHMAHSPAFKIIPGMSNTPVDNDKVGQSSSKAEPQSFVEALTKQDEDHYNENHELSSWTEIPSFDRITIRICTAISLLTLLHHESVKVRLATAKTYSTFTDGAVLLFCLPALMVRLREEGHPAVAIRLLQDALACDGIICHRETAPLALRALLRVMKSIEMPNNNQQEDGDNKTITQATSVMQTVLVAIAKAAKHAPGRVTKILVVEIEALRTRFDRLQPGERIAGAAAISRLVQERPARGTKFVPFITCCIDRKSTAVAPQATAICLDAMSIMCDEDVMDPTKTVKIVVKKLNPISSLDSSVMKSFLRLLGCAAQGNTSSRKARSVTESLIQLLRKCVTLWIPVSSAVKQRANTQTDTSDNIVLTWSHVAQAAKSLAGFSVHDILRIDFSHEEPLIDLDAERQRLEKIEEACGIFVDQLLNSLRLALKAADLEAKQSLQILLKKIAKHEWDERPRGNFDPERIAHLRATSNALKRSRKRAEALKNPSANQGMEENETLQQQFAHAVEGMPVGVIRTLCTQSARFDPFAIRACAEAGAVTTALRWPRLIDQWFSEAWAEEHGGKDITDEYIDDKWSAGLCVLRLGQASDESDLLRIRSRWFAPEDFGSCGHLQATQLFLGCLSFFEDRLPQVSQFLQDPAVLKTLVEVMGRIQLDDGKRQKAMQALLSTMEQMDVLGIDVVDVERAMGDLMPDHVMKMVWTSKLSKVRVRLICHIGEGGAIRAVAADVVRDSQLSSDHVLLAVVGRAVAQLRADARRGLICQFAESPSVPAAIITCHGVGASPWLPDLIEALRGSVSLCEQGERIAIEKLAAVT